MFCLLTTLFFFLLAWKTGDNDCAAPMGDAMVVGIAMLGLFLAAGYSAFTRRKG